MLKYISISFFKLRLLNLILFFMCHISSATCYAGLKIGFLSSWQIRCGIAAYTKHHYDALVNRGHQVTVYDYTIDHEELLKKIQDDTLDIFHVQYERGFFPNQPVEAYVELLKKVKGLGVKVIVTMHSEELCTVDIAKTADRCLYHKEPIYSDRSQNSRLYVIPHGVPVFNPSAPRTQLRKKYGFLPSQSILTTFGFMVSWKKHAEILELLAPLLKMHPHYTIQLLTSFNDFDRAGCLSEERKIKDVIEKYGIQDQVIHITSFLPEQEIQERLHCSDLGYLWCDVNSTSSSGAFKEFVSARLPLVATNCTHYPRIAEGIIRTPINKQLFIDTIYKTLGKANFGKLRNKLERVYQELNYNKIILKHIDIYAQALANK